MVRGAVAKGLLVDKPPKAYLGYTLEEVRQMSNAVKQVSSYGSQGATADRTQAQAALQFVLQNQAVCSVVAGMRTKEQLKENVGAMDSSRLTSIDVRQLSLVLEPNIYSDHR